MLSYFLVILFISLPTFEFLMLPSTISTVINYNGRINSFNDWAFGSEANEASRIRNKFTNLLKINNVQPGSRILDVGSGPGRDMAEFLALGYKCVGVEPSVQFCEISISKLAEKYDRSLFNVIDGDICDEKVVNVVKSWNNELFAGIFCLASLFHIPYSSLPIAFHNMRSVLADGGLILTSFPIREGIPDNALEGNQMPDGRWATVMSEQQHVKLLEENQFSIVDSFNCRIYNGNWSCIIARK